MEARGAGVPARARDVRRGRPLPALGGAGFALFGAVAASGIRTLSRVDFERNANVIIVAISLALGLIPVAAQDFYAGLPAGMQIVLNSSITAGSIVAIALNAVFNILRGGTKVRSLPASRPPGRVEMSGALSR